MPHHDLKSSVEARARAIALAYERPGEALAAARAVPDAWYRAQALAAVARHVPAERRTALLEARSAAKLGKDAFQRSAVLAWPLSAALLTGETALAEAIFADALDGLRGIDLHASRAEACDLVFQAAAPGGASLWRPLVAALPELCPPDAHWRCARLFRSVAGVLADIDGGVARRFVDTMPAGKARDRCHSDRAKGVKHPPRRYF